MEQASLFWPKINYSESQHDVVVDSLVIVFFLDREACYDSESINKAFALFWNSAGKDCLKYFVDEHGYTTPLPKDPLSFVQQEIKLMIDLGDIIGFTMLDHEYSGNRCEFQYVHNPDLDISRWPEEKSYIFFRLSADKVAEVGLGAIEILAQSLCRVLPFASGYVSPALSYGHSRHLVHHFIYRYPGFDIAEPSAIAFDIGDRPVGAYWLNFWGPRLVQNLGGRTAIRSNLGSSIDVYDHGGGVVVKLGETPNVGDLHQGIGLPLHQALAEFLGPYLQVPSMGYLADADGRTDEDFQRLWHLRFLFLPT